MTLWVLDTDHLSLYQRGDVRVRSHLGPISHQPITITVITTEEQLRGRLAQIRAPQTEPARIEAYHWLGETVEMLKDFTILGYDASASAIYESLRRQKLRLGTQDLRIAAIVLAVGGTLVTRNQQDFGQVFGLTLEDWTK